MSEKLQQIILDPSAVAYPGRTEVALMGSGLEVAKDGLDFADAEFKQFLAEGQFGSRPIDGIWPSVTVKIPLIISAAAGVSFDDWRVKLEQKAADFNLGGGGQIKRVFASGRYQYADITGAKLHLGAGWSAENIDFDREALLELQRLPDWYGDEVEGPVHEFTGDGSFTEIVGGTLPARVESLIVTDASGHNQRGLLWNFRAQNYSSAETAKWAYNAESLELLDLAEKATLTGSYGIKVVKHPNLSTEWTPVLGTTIGGTSFLTHTGVYDVWARVYTTSGKLPWLRLLWDLGDMVSPSENVQAQVPGREGFYLVSLGQVNLAELPFGAQRWKGVVYARGEAGGENVSIDRLWFPCADESSGVLRAAASPVSLSSIKASDSLAGSGGLNGSSAQRGGKWEESGSSKGGFTRAGEGAVREFKEDPEGRTALLSESTVGAVGFKCEDERDAGAVGLVRGFYLRYYSSTYFIRISSKITSLGLPTKQLKPVEGELLIEYCAGGALQTISLLPTAEFPATTFALLEAELSDAAEVTVRYMGSTLRATLPATFKEGEAHAEGKIGIYDFNPSTTAVARIYRTLVAWPLSSPDAVIYASKDARLSGRGIYRESKDGGAYGPVAYPGADLPRLPVPGEGESPVEIAVKPSRGLPGEGPDSAIDKFKVQMFYRECFTEIPMS